MKRFSMLSILFIFIGIITYGINRYIGEHAELFICGFFAIAKNETGRLKYLSIMVAFVVLGVVTWTEPFQIVRVLTWLKNT